MQELEARLLLYAVAFGAGLGLVVLLRRHARAFWFHALLLGALLAATVWALWDPVRTVVLGLPIFGAFAVLSLAPSLLLMAARRFVGERRFGLARLLSATAAGLLGLPVPTRAESSFYAALADADAGRRERAERRLDRLYSRGLLPGGYGGAALVRALPAAHDGDSEAVLSALEEHPSAAPVALGLEARAAAETGDFRRALDALRSLRRFARLTSLYHHTARVVLAAAGRLDFLRAAAADRLAVMRVERGARDLVVARAAEACGDLTGAAELYASAERRARGAMRRHAAAGRARVAAGHARRASLDPELTAEFLALETHLRAPEQDLVGATRRAVLAVPALSLLAFAVSVITFVWVGDDGDRLGAGVIELLLGGALSAPMIRGDGEWWRLFTTMNLHGGWVHLLMNLGSILLIGWPLESRVGWAPTTVVYIGAGVAGSLASVYVNDTAVGVGASGAAMGLIGALGVLLLARRRLFEAADRKRWLNVLTLCVVATAGIGVVEHRFIDNAAHGVGLLAGALLMWPLLPALSVSAVRAGAAGSRPSPRSSVPIALAIALAALLVGSEVAAVRAAQPLVVAQDGVRAELLGLLRARPHPLGGVLAERAPLGVRVYLGREPRDTPSPLRLLPEGSGPRRCFLRHRSDVPIGSDAVVLRPSSDRDVADLGPDFPFGFRVLRVSNGAAFALVLLPEEPGVESEFGPLVESIRATLAPMR